MREFDRAIREHRELKLRNSVLDEAMPLQPYLARTAIENHALFTSEPATRTPERQEASVEPWPEREHQPLLEAAESLWRDDPSFNWGD